MSVVDVIVEGELRIPATVNDLNSFRAWAHSKDFPQTGKISFIGNHIDVNMSPEDLHWHNAVKTDLGADLVYFVRLHKLGRVRFDGAFLVNERADLGTVPDMMFCSWASLKSGKVRYATMGKKGKRPMEVAGSPDLVVEIVSKSSVTKDTVHLRKTYFAAGIAEYWLIDARGDEVDFQILTRSKRGYVAVPADRDGYRRSPLFRHSFFLSREIEEADEESYRLLSK